MYMLIQGIHSRFESNPVNMTLFIFKKKNITSTNPNPKRLINMPLCSTLRWTHLNAHSPVSVFDYIMRIMVWWWNQVCMSNGKLCYVQIQICAKLMWKFRESFVPLVKQVRKATHVWRWTCIWNALVFFSMCLPIECQITRDKGNFHKHTAMKNVEEKKNETKTTTTNFFNGICTTFVYNWRRDVVGTFFSFFFC